MEIGYTRVSTKDQNLEMQIKAMVASGVSKSKIYYDYQSGKSRNRPYFEMCMKSLREGDTLVIYSLDRLGRSTKDLIDILNELAERNINLKILDGIAKGIDTRTHMGKMFFTIASAFAEYEREIISQRTIAGLEVAKANGRIGGRKPAFNKKQINTLKAALKGGALFTDLAEQYGVSRKTLYQYFSPDGELRELAKNILSD